MKPIYIVHELKSYSIQNATLGYTVLQIEDLEKAEAICAALNAESERLEEYHKPKKVPSIEEIIHFS